MPAKTRSVKRFTSSKFRNIKHNGYDSKREAARAQELALLQHIGEITDLEYQVEYELIPKQEGERAVKYRADFRYRENGAVVVEDCKGFKTPEYILKRKLMKWVHGITIRES